MNAQHWNSNPESCPRERRRSGSFLGVILIALGIYWILKETGWVFHLPGIEFLRDGVFAVYDFFHHYLGKLLVPVVLLVIGLLLVSGRRRIGWLVLLLLVLVFMPGLIVPGVLLIIAFPVILIVLGLLVIRSIF